MASKDKGRKETKKKSKGAKTKEAQLNFLEPKLGQAKVHANPTPYWGSVASKNKNKGKKSNDSDIVRIKGGK